LVLLVSCAPGSKRSDRGERLATVDAPLVVEAAKLVAVASDGASGDYFGESVSLSGSWAVVGAGSDGHKFISIGSAYVFKRKAQGNWAPIGWLTASDGGKWDVFGTSVSISGSRIVIGAPGHDGEGPGYGAAYVFERDQNWHWTEVAKLTASDGAEFFGGSVSLSGNKTVIGARHDEANGSSSGAAYVFKRHPKGNWSEVQKLTASDGGAEDWFGDSVSVSGSYAVVGAPYGDVNGVISGAAYVFERDGQGSWIEVAKLTAPDGSAFDRLGSSVSISGSVVLLGVGRDDDFGYESGSAYVFERNAQGNWIHTQKLFASDAATEDGFGYSVSVEGSIAAISAPYDGDEGKESGSVYLFERDAQGTWEQTQKLTASDSAPEVYFGVSVAVSGNFTLVGASRAEGKQPKSGAAYAFQPESCLP